jgi:hypothetical protein
MNVSCIYLCARIRRARVRWIFVGQKSFTFFSFQMFGFPTDLFGVPNGNTRRTNNNALLPQQPSLFGNSLMVPSPFAGVSNFFGDFGLGSPPFAMMDRLMHDANQDSTAPVHSFTSTTVMSFNGPDGRPKVYQETTSRNRGPGGIEETRQAVRDTERGINKVWLIARRCSSIILRWCPL